MAERRSEQKRRVRDARGRRAKVLDPVSLRFVHNTTDIPSETLEAMTEELMPGARRQRTWQFVSAGLSLLLIFGGTAFYFTFVSNWKGFDFVNTTIYLVQFTLVAAGPFIALRVARAKYGSRIAEVMLHHRHCPHCGYSLHGLPPDPQDNSTVCPECGCAWRLNTVS